MRLTPEQLEQFDRDGYLFFPGLFTPEETQNLTDAVPELYSRREAYNVREKGSDAVRTNFAAHMYSEPFAKLARHLQSVVRRQVGRWRAVRLPLYCKAPTEVLRVYLPELDAERLLRRSVQQQQQRMLRHVAP